MNLISNRIRLLQGLNLSIYGLISISFFVFWVQNRSINNLIIFLIEFIVFGLANFFFT